MTFVVLQSTCWGKKSCLLYMYCLPDVMWLLYCLCLILMVSWFGQQCVIWTFSGPAHLHFEKYLTNVMSDSSSIPEVRN